MRIPFATESAVDGKEMLMPFFACFGNSLKFPANSREKYQVSFYPNLIV